MMLHCETFSCLALESETAHKKDKWERERKKFGSQAVTVCGMWKDTEIKYNKRWEIRYFFCMPSKATFTFVYLHSFMPGLQTLRSIDF